MIGIIHAMKLEEPKDELKNRIGKSKLTFTDKVIGRSILNAIPRKIRPNTVTFFRLCCIPFVIYFFLTYDYFWGSIIFIAAALSDALDGAMARIRHQITTVGKFYDPLADKLLIGSAAVILLTRCVNIWLALVIIFLEVIIITAAIYKKITHPKANIQAKLPGKIKMVLQCVGVILLLFFILFKIGLLLLLAEIILWVAVAFALASIFSYNSI